MANDKLATQGTPRRRGFDDLVDSTTDYFDKLASKMKPNEHRMTSGMVYGEQVKYVSWDIPDEKFSTLEVMQITDVQFGHVTTKYDRILEYRDWVLARPNRYMVWCGDNVDAWAMWSPGRAFDQIADPQSQVFKFCEVFAPVRHRILGYVGGNHERRAIPAFGDLGTLIATLLRIPYSNGRQIVDIHFGKHTPFQISLWHGTGGARTKGTVAQILNRFMEKGNANLYMMGHLHQPLVLPIWKEVADPRSRTIQVRKAMGVVGSSFMELWNSYGEISGYTAGDVLMGCVRIEANGKWELSLR